MSDSKELDDKDLEGVAGGLLSGGTDLTMQKYSTTPTTTTTTSTTSNTLSTSPTLTTTTTTSTNPLSRG